MKPYTGLPCRVAVCLAVVLLISSVCRAAGDGGPAAEPDGNTIRILGIGNSFLVDATSNLNRIVSSAGHTLIMQRASRGGASLETHLEAALKHEANPDDPEGKPYTRAKLSLKELLTSQPWDFVTIQQVSHRSVDIDSFRPHAAKLCDYIKQYAPNAEIVFHQTWAYREDRFKDGAAGQTAMYQGLARSYHTMAAELGISKIIPVGNAFQLAWESPDGKFQPDTAFDFKNARYPDLPKERNSLHRGFYWKKVAGTQESQDHDDAVAADGSRMKLSRDVAHLGREGKYLAACVWFEFFFRHDARTVSFQPEGIGEERAEFLRETAHRAATELVRPVAWPNDKQESKE